MSPDLSESNGILYNKKRGKKPGVPNTMQKKKNLYKV